ncbi:O-methyltransferase [Labedaea rhizosphaerae]|uniref:O-methyltransferase n=2 Tax=Labedaea rhizosphaerae TaxID=598644 RepID=A0A4R6SJA7_LABRH|nr:O-methyltransferase [Labedaea rhizosphaerae]
MALRVAVTLGLPSRLSGVSVPVEELAAELKVSSVPLELLLNHLSTLGVVERLDDGFRLTPFGANLRDPFTEVLLRLDSSAGRAELAFVELAHSVATGEAAYPRRYGQDFWADLAADPSLRESFDRQMVLRFQGQVPQILLSYDWSQFSSILDVGGGRGDLLSAILSVNPEMRGNLLDLSPTAEEALETFRARGVADRAEVTAQSFFDPLPVGFDACLLVDIIHDWDDFNAHRILARCIEAAPVGGRILVVEGIGGRRAATDMDLSMLVIFGGRERTVAEFQALGADHGLVLESVVDLTDQRCLIEFRVDGQA